MYGDQWTALRVRDRLIAAFRFFGDGAFSPAKNLFEQVTDYTADGFQIPVDGAKLIAEAYEIIAESSSVLGRESDQRHELLTYIGQCRREGVHGAITRTAERLGRKRGTVEKSIPRTLERIATGLNERERSRGLSVQSPRTALRYTP